MREIIECFCAEVLQEIGLTIHQDGQVNPFPLPPGEYEFIGFKADNGTLRIALANQPEVCISKDCFELFFHPHRGTPGIQIRKIS